MRLCRALLGLLVPLVLLAATARGQDVGTCDALFRQTEAVRDSLRAEFRRAGEMRRETLTRSATTARAARQCYGRREADRVGVLFQRELYALNALGLASEAVRVARRFEDEHAARSSAAVRLYVLRQQAAALERLGRLDDAVQTLRRALAQIDALSPLARAGLLHQIADLYEYLTDYAAARRYLGQAERLLTSHQADADLLPVVLTAQVDLVVAEADATGRRDTTVLRGAARRAVRAATLHAERRQRLDVPIAHIKAMEAFAYAGAPEEALPHLEQAQRLAARTGHPVVQMVVAYKGGRLHLQRAAFDQAAPLLRRAWGLARARGDVGYLRRIAYDRGLLHELQGEAEEAAGWYRRAIDLTEEHHGNLRTFEWAAATFSEWQAPYRGLVRVRLAQGRVEDAFVELERTRARRLHYLRRAHAVTDGLSDADRLRLDSLTSVLERARDALRPLAPTDHRRLPLEVRESTAQVRIDRLLGIERRVPVVRLDSIRARLARENRVLVSYLVDRPNPVMPRPPTSLAFVLTADTLRAIRLDVDAARLERLVGRVSPVLLGDQHTLAFDELQFNLDALHALYRTVFAPVALHVEPGRRVTVVPDGHLFAVPFGMLVTETAGPYSYDSASFLIERHPLTLDVSVALGDPRPSAGPPPVEVAAFGRADFGAVRDTLPSVLRSREAFDLPLVRDELETVGGLFRSVHVALDDQATESAFYERARRAEVLHVATHATTDPTSPLFNAFVLTPSEDADEDGVVHLYELLRRDLDASLVVLSGCNTGRGALFLGEGVQGLQHGFLAAGARSVLAANWFVEDRASLRLVRAFYRHLRDGLPKDVALQRAQVAYLREAPAAVLSPFFWAAPVLYGQPDAMALEPAPSSVVWWLVVAAVLVLAGALGWRRRYRRAASV